MKYCRALKKFCDDSEVCKTCLDLYVWNREHWDKKWKQRAAWREARKQAFILGHRKEKEVTKK